MNFEIGNIVGEKKGEGEWKGQIKERRKEE